MTYGYLFLNAVTCMEPVPFQINYQCSLVRAYLIMCSISIYLARVMFPKKSKQSYAALISWNFSLLEQKLNCASAPDPLKSGSNR